VREREEEGEKKKQALEFLLSRIYDFLGDTTF